MGKNLMIVESPAKAKTIEKFLGEDFVVKSCYGHIRDLPRGDMGIDVEKGYEPNYVISEDKKKLVTELKKLAKDAEQIWLATDEDREGEAISWHLCEALGLDPKEAKRIVFHEITKSAIQNAVQQPRKINQDLVNAQQARRILDRLVGFEISPVLWRKTAVKAALSAGRVQSVAVRLIVDREREINGFEISSQYRITGEFILTDSDGKSYLVKAELPNRFDAYEDALEFVKNCEGNNYSVADIQKKPSKKSPAAPFTTSTLQQEASRKLGYSVSKTMVVAQRLYESGKITYMRTDSVNLSDLALNTAASTIKENFGEEYHQVRKYKTKSSGAQEAHEAIRPTYINQQHVSGENDEQRLYDLIWKRTVASQMADAQLEKTTVKIQVGDSDNFFIAKGEVIKFEGFLKLYVVSSDEDEDEEDSGILPPMSIGDILQMKQILATERFSRPPARYTEASLVRKLEELGIGRPSTYAPTISVIQKRGYVVKKDKEGTERKFKVIQLDDKGIDQLVQTEMAGGDKSKLFPTDVGSLVNDFLKEHFTKIMDYNFTAQIEQEFDEIAHGDKEWSKMIDSFYKPFHVTVEDTLENAERVTGERLLGEDPESKRPVYARIGKYGPMIQIGDREDEEKPRFAKLKPDQNIETISFEEAMRLFDLPRTLGVFEEKEVIVAEGRYGPYVRHDNKFASIKKDMDPFSITLDQAIELIKAKREADAQKVIAVYEEDDIQILRGPYGPYIKSANKNFRIPKGTDAEALTVDDCKKIIEEAPKAKGKRGAKKRKA